MAFTIYRSSDAGAPTLNNAAGALLTLLNAILVNGYGTQPAAGWSNGTAAANQNFFKNASPCSPTGTGTGFYLNVSDNATVTGSEARCTGYETMTAPGTGSGTFPNLLGVADQRGSETNPYGWLNWRKSSAAANRPWVCFADNLTFYFFVQSEGTAQYAGFGFGDFYSLYGSADQWRCIIMGRNTDNSATLGVGSMDQCALIGGFCVSTSTTAVCSHYVDRTYGGGGNSGIAVGKHGDLTKAGVSSVAPGSLVLGVTGVGTPNGPDNAYYFSPIWVHEILGANSGNVRGRLRGLWHVCHPYTSFSDGAIFTATGALQGKTFYVIRQTDGGGCLAVETSNTLESN